MSEAVVVRDQPSTAVAVTPMAMLQLAVEKGASVEQLERLMALQERYEANEAKKEFVAAMTQFKEHPLVIEKNKLVDFTGTSGKRTHYRHATLANVCDTTAGYCVQCQDDHDCIGTGGGNTPVCNPNGYYCVQCLGDQSCPGSTCNAAHFCN